MQLQKSQEQSQIETQEYACTRWYHHIRKNLHGRTNLRPVGRKHCEILKNHVMDVVHLQIGSPVHS